MTIKEKRESCIEFMNKLAMELKDQYEFVGSCNKDVSAYLIPNGTISELSYYGKPKLSFRVSDHWNWFSNVKKCKDRYHVQCHSVDMPRPRCRLHDDEGPTKPRIGWQVAIFGNDGRYHHVFGERFDRENHAWVWEEKQISEVLAMVR